jgi:hypothetical protein
LFGWLFFFGFCLVGFYLVCFGFGWFLFGWFSLDSFFFFFFLVGFRLVGDTFIGLGWSGNIVCILRTVEDIKKLTGPGTQKDGHEQYLELLRN